MTPLTHRTVVVPVDFSDDSEVAVRAGRERVEEAGDLHVVHVMVELDYTSPGVKFGTVTDDSRRQAVEKHLQELLQQARASGATTTVLIGDGGLKIADYAEQVAADLIIVPSHGYHGIKRLLLGSTAERIIRHAKCSVLVLRRRDAQ